MKTLVLTIFMLLMTGAHASIEHDGKTQAEPTAAEIQKNRACFEEVAKNGCGDPGEDIKQFRSCLHNVFPTLSVDCKKMMTKLYSNKK